MPAQGASGAALRAKSLALQVSIADGERFDATSDMVEAIVAWAANPGDWGSWQSVVRALDTIRALPGGFGRQGGLSTVEGVRLAGSSRTGGGAGGVGGELGDRVSMILAGVRGIVPALEATGCEAGHIALAGEALGKASSEMREELIEAIAAVKIAVSHGDGFELEREALEMLCSVDDLEVEKSSKDDAFRRAHERGIGELLQGTEFGTGLEALVETIQAHRDVVEGGSLTTVASERLVESSG